MPKPVIAPTRRKSRRGTPSQKGEEELFIGKDERGTGFTYRRQKPTAKIMKATGS
jgi:hypothetical protein